MTDTKRALAIAYAVKRKSTAPRIAPMPEEPEIDYFADEPLDAEAPELKTEEMAPASVANIVASIRRKQMVPNEG